MTHAGKVKCIYIDPPYNTGNRDFIYNDRFIDKDDVYKHSKWLEFMYRRLLLAKELLAEDGVIFVSIDDNEVFNLGLLMNRIFGETNHVATCVWQKRYSRENRGAIGDAHEYLIVFAMNPAIFKERRNKISLTEKQIAVYKNVDPVHGRWRDIPMTAQGFRPNQMYEIVAPNGKRHRPPEGRCWSTVEAQYLKLYKEGRIYFGKDGNGTPRIIRYLSEVEGVVPWTWWPHEEVGHTDEAKKEIQSMFGTQTAFDTPKPIRLIERVLSIATKPGDLVLDFFAGSGTTAHAVLKLNAEDGGDRRFILVSSTEAVEEQIPPNPPFSKGGTGAPAAQTDKAEAAIPAENPSISAEGANPPPFGKGGAGGISASGTTAHAVLKLNAEDGGDRRFILVSSTEAVEEQIPPSPPFPKGGIDAPAAHRDEGKAAATFEDPSISAEGANPPPFEKGGPGGISDKNLCRDICAERVRRVMRGYSNKKGEAVAGLGGDFAYLRARRIPAEALLSRIEHGQVWTALQLIHTGTLRPYESGAALQTAELADGLLIYCPKVTEQTPEQLLALAAGRAETVVYSWQPGWLRQYLDERITLEQIPAFLINRFGGGHAAYAG